MSSILSSHHGLPNILSGRTCCNGLSFCSSCSFHFCGPNNWIFQKQGAEIVCKFNSMISYRPLYLHGMYSATWISIISETANTIYIVSGLYSFPSVTIFIFLYFQVSTFNQCFLSFPLIWVYNFLQGIKWLCGICETLRMFCFFRVVVAADNGVPVVPSRVDELIKKDFPDCKFRVICMSKMNRFKESIIYL